MAAAVIKTKVHVMYVTCFLFYSAVITIAILQVSQIEQYHIE